MTSTPLQFDGPLPLTVAAEAATGVVDHVEDLLPAPLARREGIMGGHFGSSRYQLWASGSGSSSSTLLKNS